MSRPAAAFAVLALATAACFPVAGEAELVVEEQVDEVTLEPLPAEPPGGAPAPDDVEGELVAPTPGMADVRPVPWDAATIDGTTVTVAWWSGVEPCNVLDRVEVIERDDEVVITVVEGTADREAACIEIGVRKRTEVELTEPVGPRSLVDGADEAS